MLGFITKVLLFESKHSVVIPTGPTLAAARPADRGAPRLLGPFFASSSENGETEFAKPRNIGVIS